MPHSASRLASFPGRSGNEATIRPEVINCSSNLADETCRRPPSQKYKGVHVCYTSPRAMMTSASLWCNNDHYVLLTSRVIVATSFKLNKPESCIQHINWKCISLQISTSVTHMTMPSGNIVMVSGRMTHSLSARALIILPSYCPCTFP